MGPRSPNDSVVGRLVVTTNCLGRAEDFRLGFASGCSGSDEDRRGESVVSSCVNYSLEIQHLI